MRLLILGLLALFPLSAHGQAAPTWRLELIHAIRPGEGTPGMLGNVTRIAATDDGAVYVVEITPARIALFDKTGTFSRVIMREGAGPREYRYPIIALQRDTLAVFDPSLGRLTRVAPDGKLIDQRQVSVGDRTSQFWMLQDGTAMIQIHPPRIQDGGAAVRVTRAGRLDTVQWRHPTSEDRTLQFRGPTWVLKGRIAFSPPGVATFDPAGHVVVGGTRRSSWFVISGHDTVKIVTLPDQSIPIAGATRDSAWAAFVVRARASIAGEPGFDDVVRKELFPTTLPPWVTFDINPRNEWWIGRSSPTGTLGSWDVVDRGRLVGHAIVPAPVVTTGAGEVAYYGKDVIALLHTDSDGAPWIGVYRVARNAH